jgi:hypothetical protein
MADTLCVRKEIEYRFSGGACLKISLPLVESIKELAEF